jgi:hypothetical protein
MDDWQVVDFSSLPPLSSSVIKTGEKIGTMSFISTNLESSSLNNIPIRGDYNKLINLITHKYTLARSKRSTTKAEEHRAQ